MDILLLTLINVAGCLVFPKLLSFILAVKNRCNQLSPSSTIQTKQNNKTEITSFPYCTGYTLTKSSFCKFYPSFCDRCSPG
ncbi:hypothetical protein SD81_020835 [Tolypothrix campylonemoides VB511288]|nr:hypothetical protein SD81_020835 [Tolypothrix campylonemoides VB511288]